MSAETPTVRTASPTGMRRDGPRAVRLKRGEQPTHSSMTGFQRWAWKTFRARVLARPPDPTLDENLVKAHIRMRSDEYMAVVYATTVVVGIATVIAGAVVGFLFVSAGSLLLGLLIGVLLPVFGTVGTYFALMGTPASKAKERGRKIDRKISPAMSFVSAMSSADVNVDQIFKELGRQKIYGEVAEEAAWITRDTELLGVDILTAIRRGAGRTPSRRFQDFLQGVVTTATSGGQLKPYFLLKAEQFERENKLEMLQRTETMGLLAETFVTVVVAFPLFLVIIIAIFAIIGGGGSFMLEILWGIVGGMIPLSQFGFIFFMYTLTQEMM
ncbi:MAG TPA: type II secretion system F family protein [Thermoplasmata archaeon]|nr:type II secretion system F family protein [Thermoplasmata archaeon]